MNKLQACEKRYANLKMLWERDRELIEELLGVLVFLDTAIMPEERKYDEFGWCSMHRDILTDLDNRVKAAIAKARGETST